METKKSGSFTQSLTFKGIIAVALILFLMIPQNMILNLIRERQDRSLEAIERINDKWSDTQTICGPILSIPYQKKIVETEMIETKDKKKEKYERISYERHILNITPEQLKLKAELFPEEKHYGIYKTILYRSNIIIEGDFKNLLTEKEQNIEYELDKAYISIGLSDLKGVSNQVEFNFAGQKLDVEAGGNKNAYSEKQLICGISGLGKLYNEGNPLSFRCDLSLNGSGSLNFIPVGKTTQVNVSGAWNSPGFIGNFSPEYTIENGIFAAEWNVLHFNRNIPETWIDYTNSSFYDNYFGVNLVDPVDHYQQNTRSAKYAIMFIALTFVVFFFVEILTKKRIHPIQYLLVGIALILFYSLLLSISEQVSFGIAYLIASVATIGLITAYTHSIFKNTKQTGILTALLCLLYTFLYVVLQLEDVALLIGSIGLFIILGVIMYVSRKINWYKQEEEQLISDK